jgi:hypothetical protein
MNLSLTRVSCGSPDAVAAAEELPHHPRPDEAACSGDAHQLLAIVGNGRHGLLAVFVCVEAKAVNAFCCCCLIWWCRSERRVAVFIPEGYYYSSSKVARSWLGQAQLRLPSRGD